MNATNENKTIERTRKITVKFDGSCSFCRAWAGRGRHWLKGQGLRFEPLTDGRNARELQVVTAAGDCRPGVDGLVHVASQVWWLRPLAMASRVPGVINLERRMYAWFAARRHCGGGQCSCRPASLKKESVGESVAGLALAWGPLILLLLLALFCLPRVPGWVAMWMIVAAIFGGFKWLTWWHGRSVQGTVQRTLAYLLMWPGMDWKTFATAKRRTATRTTWWLVLSKICLGAVLFWGVARCVPADWSLIRGWMGLLGLAFLLHFGFLPALALWWGVEPIMHAPILAKSVNDFWSRRWNTAFPQLAGPFWFEPLRERAGTKIALLAVFLISGWLHELVISVPAGGGYGWPTAYFLIQAAGILCERGMVHRRVWAWLIIAGPAVILFHPTFLQQVVLPMMKTLGAL